MQARRMILVCMNERPAGKESCLPSGSGALLAALKEEIKARGLKGPVRAVGTGCLAQCAGGPHCVVWPEGVWYRGVQAADAGAIVGHLAGGPPVERLRAPDPGGSTD